VGLGTYMAEEMEVVGDTLESLINGDFTVNWVVAKRQLPPAASAIVSNLVAPRPLIDEKRCTRCGTCVEICPVTPKAVDCRGGSRALPARHNYDRCIRWHCCQEVCPEKAIRVHKGLFGI
jgi:formate hydrogenlyase subunit 6/NADH:ubiquinone oxidoreductase subunit I